MGGGGGGGGEEEERWKEVDEGVREEGEATDNGRGGERMTGLG